MLDKSGGWSYFGRIERVMRGYENLKFKWWLGKKLVDKESMIRELGDSGVWKVKEVLRIWFKVLNVVE